MATPGMKLLDRSKLEAAYITFSTIFDMALTTTAVIYPEIATVIPDAGPINQFKWLGDVPVMQEWVGDRVINRLRAETHELRTKWFSNGIELDYDDVGEDRLGIVSPRIRQLARMGPKKIDAVVVDMYNNGFAGTLGLTYDGQFLWDSDHTADGAGVGASQTNLQTGALSDVTYNQAIQKMMEFKGTNGEPLEIKPDTLLVGTSNQLVARKLLQQAFKSTGESNIDQGTSRLIINARIVGAHAAKWYLLATQEDIRPVLVGVEVPPAFAEIMGWDQYQQFMRRTMLAGAHMKVGFCYGMWQTGIGGVGS